MHQHIEYRSQSGDQQQSRAGYAVLIVRRQSARQQAVRGHGLDQAAERYKEADHAGGYAAEGRYAEHGDANVAQRRAQAVEGGYAFYTAQARQRGCIVLPSGKALGLYGRCAERKHDIRHCGSQQSHEDDGHDAFCRESEAVGRMGYRLKTDECPWRQYDYAYHLKGGAFG